MGLFNKDDNKKTREVGSNFDKSNAEKIFDALDRVESKPRKEVSENLKREMKNTKNVSELLSDAQGLMMSEKFDEAVKILKQVITIMPENGEAYMCLADIYDVQDDRKSEINILKSAIQNVNSSKAKAELMNRLKQLNE